MLLEKGIQYFLCGAYCHAVSIYAMSIQRLKLFIVKTQKV
jgi:hypothetical protein